MCIPAQDSIFVKFFLPFFTGVEFLDVCDAGALPPEGVVEVSLEAADLAVVEGVLGVAGLGAAGVLLVAVGGRVEPVAGRGDAVVLAAGLRTQEEDEDINRHSTAERCGAAECVYVLSKS